MIKWLRYALLVFALVAAGVSYGEDLEYSYDNWVTAATTIDSACSAALSRAGFPRVFVPSANSGQCQGLNADNQILTLPYRQDRARTCPTGQTMGSDGVCRFVRCPQGDDWTRDANMDCHPPVVNPPPPPPETPPPSTPPDTPPPETPPPTTPPDTGGGTGSGSGGTGTGTGTSPSNPPPVIEVTDGNGNPVPVPTPPTTPPPTSGPIVVTPPDGSTPTTPPPTGGGGNGVSVPPPPTPESPSNPGGSGGGGGGAPSTGGGGGSTPSTGDGGGDGDTPSTGGGTGGEGFCAENPDLQICKDSTVAGECEAVACSGDAIQCATLRAAAALECRDKKDRDALDASPLKAVGEGGSAGNDPLKGNFPTVANGQHINGPSSLDTGGWLGGGSCFPDTQVSVAGRSVVIPFSKACDSLIIFRYAIMVIAGLVSFRIISGAVLS